MAIEHHKGSHVLEVDSFPRATERSARNLQVKTNEPLLMKSLPLKTPMASVRHSTRYGFTGTSMRYAHCASDSSVDWKYRQIVYPLGAYFLVWE